MNNQLIINEIMDQIRLKMKNHQHVRETMFVGTDGQFEEETKNSDFNEGFDNGLETAMAIIKELWDRFGKEVS